MDVSAYVRENYYGGEMDAEEVISWVYRNGDDSTRQFVADNYYGGDADIEEVMAGIR